jgi:hypothetical protein
MDFCLSRQEGVALLHRGTDQQAQVARHVYHVSGRIARMRYLLPGKNLAIKASGHFLTHR